MGAIKDNHYTEFQEKLSLIGKAFGHPGRVKLLQILFENKEGYQNVEIAIILNFSKRTVKDHVDTLKKAKLIKIKYFRHYYEIKISKRGKVLLTFMLLFKGK